MGKLLFFDVDGTLYNSQKKLPESTIEALQLARDNGHEIAIATGRSPFMIKDLLEQLQIDTYVTFNGQYVVYKGEVVFTDGVGKEQLEQLVRFGQKRNEPVVFISDREMVASQNEFRPIDESLASLKIAYPRIDPHFYKENDVYQTLIYVSEEEEYLYREAFPNIQFVRWHKYSCDVLPKEGSKARGIEKLLRYADYEMDEVIAFGDGLNDVEMLQAVGTGVVMGNGHPKALAVGDVIAPHVDEKGIYRVMKQLALI